MNPSETRSYREEYAELRRRMVEEQLLGRGIADPRVLRAMLAVPREDFVPPPYRPRAYDDGPLPIGGGQTISQPYTVAFMCEALGLKGSEKILEVGAGSGYGAAVLGHLAKEVFAIERLPALAESARRRIAEQGLANVAIITGDGALGLPAAAPFDAIVVTAAAPAVPPALCEQLSPEGGRLVIPVGELGQPQSLMRLVKNGDRVDTQDLGAFSFVPLLSGVGWGQEGF